MDSQMPSGNSDSQDVTMTNADEGSPNIFDEMLAEMDGQWGSQDPFMLQNEVPPERYIDPALFAQSLGMPDVYRALPSASASPTRHEEQTYPFGIDSSPVRPAEQVPVSTPSRQQANTPATLSDYSPDSAGLHTPTRRDRGHYGSARRRTGALSNFQNIAPSPQREAAQANTGYTFEPIPEHQQGILSPSHYINEDLPEFRPRRVIPESESRYDNGFNFPEELRSPCLTADPDAFEGAAGGLDSQGTESGATQDMAQLQNVLQFSNQFPVAPPAYTAGPPGTMAAGTTVPAVSRGSTASNTIAPWASGLTFQQEPDPERRAKMQEIASVSHMLLTSKHTVFAAKKAKVLQAGQAADEQMRNKKPTKRARKNTTAQGNTVSNPSAKTRPENNTARNEKQIDADDVPKNANNSGNLAPPASTNQPAISQPALSQPVPTSQPVSFNQPAPASQLVPINQPVSINPPVSIKALASSNQPVSTKSSATARGRKASIPSNPTNEERITQFWNGRLDKFGNELDASLLCHGTLEKYQPGPRIDNAANESEFAQYTQEPAENHTRLSEDTPEQAPPHSELMLFSQVMNGKNCETPVYSGQVLVASYDITSDWWHRVNIWAWNRQTLARGLEEVAIVITPFHLIFARIPHTKDTGMVKKDWLSIMGLIEKSSRTPVVGAEEKTWAYMYRIVPCNVKGQNDITGSRQELSKSKEFIDALGMDTVYNGRFGHFHFYVPPVGDPVPNQDFAIRVGRFGQKGHYDRPRVEIRDLGGRRVIQD